MLEKTSSDFGSAILTLNLLRSQRSSVLCSILFRKMLDLRLACNALAISNFTVALTNAWEA